MQHKPFFCLYRVLPRPRGSANEHTQAAAETTLCAICNPGEVSLSKQGQVMASVPPRNEQI